MPKYPCLKRVNTLRQHTVLFALYVWFDKMGAPTVGHPMMGKTHIYYIIYVHSCIHTNIVYSVIVTREQTLDDRMGAVCIPVEPKATCHNFWQFGRFLRKSTLVTASIFISLLISNTKQFVVVRATLLRDRQ